MSPVTGETVGATAESFQDMFLDKLREEIEDIDRNIVEPIARRIYVTDTVAKVKTEKGLPTTDESQEEHVVERAGKSATHFEVDSNLVKAIFRLLVKMNRAEQWQNR